MECITINDAQTIAGGGTGTMLANRYRIVRQLGQGGMGSVWLAEDTQLDNKPFAIKMLPSILVSNKRAYRQLKDEALVAMKLTHPNIVTLRAFEENNGNPFLVMDYIDGETLDDYLCERGTGNGERGSGLSEEETIRVLRPVAAALDYAHSKGVVHRDVKPANVMIAKDGTPYILDFGIAREIQETLTRVTGKLSSGTLLYMSPEQLNGEAPKAPQDVYSFAAMAYECLKGEPPFVRGAIEDQIKNKAPEPLSGGTRFVASVMAGLAKKPEDRPKSCVAVLEGDDSNRASTFAKATAAREHAGRVETGGRLPSAAVGGTEDGSRKERKERKDRWNIIFGVTIILGVLAIGGSAWYRNSQQELLREQARIVAEQKAEAERKVEELRKAEEMRRAQEEAERRKREEAERKAEEERKADEARKAKEEVRKRDNLDNFLADLERGESVPSARLVAKVGSREVYGAIFRMNEREYTSPVRLDNLHEGENVGPLKVTYSENGKRYEGTFKAITVDWRGIKTYTFPLKEITGPKHGDVKTLTLPGGAKMEMIYVAPGSFMMGSPLKEAGRSDDEAWHRVTLTKGYWLGKYEVTQEQWQSVMGENPANFKCGRNPVESVSWEECQRFIQKVNAQLNCGARLPTEAEWEYACRAGTTTAYHWGNALNGDKANCNGDYPYGTTSKGTTHGRTMPVGQYGANPWGFYDMHGNVYEWCNDWYGSYSVFTTDPQGAASGSHRVLRGGCWNSNAWYCRSATRYGLDPGPRFNSHLGFRLCCSAGPRE